MLLFLSNNSRRIGDFDLLQDVRRSLGKSKRTAAVGTTIQRVRLEMVDGLWWKQRPQMLIMSRLATSFPFLSALTRQLQRLDHIAGGRLGGSRGVIARRSQLMFQLDDPGNRLRQLGFPCRNVCVLLAKAMGKAFTIRTMGRFAQLHKAGRYASVAVQTRSTE